MLRICDDPATGSGLLPSRQACERRYIRDNDNIPRPGAASGQGQGANSPHKGGEFHELHSPAD